MNMISTPPALTENDTLRADIFALFAALLRDAPTAEVLGWLAQLEADGTDSPMSRAWSALALAAQHSRPAQLEDEYQQLFIGIGRGELMPFACWYLTGSLMEKPLVSLRQDLARLGYQRQAEVHEPEDHIAALCEVMSMLIGSGQSYPLQQQFWQRHLQPWCGRFFQDLQRAQSAVFYSAVGLLGAAFCQQESLFFQQLPAGAACPQLN